MENFFRSAVVVGALLGVAGLSSVVLTGGGCASNTDISPYFSVKQEHDIPPPLSFKWDKDNPETFSYIAYDDPKGVGYFRSSSNIYYGDEQIVNLVPWYLEQMQKDGWTHKQTSMDEGKKRLLFTKGEETATIWLYRKFDTRMDRNLTFVKAKVGPTPIEALSTEELIEAQDPGDLGTTPASGIPDPVPSIDPGTKAIIQGPHGADEEEAIALPASSETGSEGVEGAVEKKTGKNKQVVNGGADRENNEESVPTEEDMKSDDDGA